MKYIICNIDLKQANSMKPYVGEPVNQNWVKLCTKDTAKRFDTINDAETFIKQQKIKRKNCEIEEVE